ncbi:MAG: hypothetical protein ABII09_12910, partial [Planctomycetota bacterium]
MRNTKYEIRTTGSAIILAVVLTSLLAIVGVIFLLSSRVDSVATSAIADNKDLNLAVDTVIAQISEALAADVPGDPNSLQEYYDYPDANNPWLACLEPYSDAGNPCWRQVSNIYGPAPQKMEAKIIPDYNDAFGVYTAADADGDGVGDSIWVPVLGKTSSKGKPIYAAIRIVDNSAMLNVNTGYKFDPCTADGSSQLQINLMALAGRPIYTTADETDLKVKRANWPASGIDPNDPSYLALYEQNVIWQYGNPNGAYAPFDISDEIEVRNRFVLNHQYIHTRLEDWTPQLYSTSKWVNYTPFNDLGEWFDTTCIDANLILPPDANYAYRHIATTQNFDRIINPNGEKMLNINRDPQIDPNTNNTRDKIANALIAGGALPADVNALAAQITANLIDYIDGPITDPNNNVTVVYDDSTSPQTPHFGFEQPCIYISELAQNFIQPDANDPNIVLKSFAIELHKPYAEDPYPQCTGPNDCSWRLVIYDSNTGIPLYYPFSWTGPTWSGTGQFFVFENDSFDFIEVNLADFEANSPSPLNGAIGVDSNIILSWPVVSGAISYDIYFGTDVLVVTNGTPNDVGVFQGNVPASTTTFDPPGLLANDTTFYWRIDTHTSTSIITGRVLRFTVSDAEPLPASVEFTGASVIWLQRRVFDSGLPDPTYVTVDIVEVPVADINEPNWLKPIVRDPNSPGVKFETHSFQRDIFPNKPIRRLWGFSSEPTIGYFNNVNLGLGVIQAHPANQAFTNVGEFGQLFYAPTYDYGGGGPDFTTTTTEPEMRINLTLPQYQQVFNYLTVFDPMNYGHDANETRIKGRININTAPWFVIAQLPWVSYHTLPNYNLARSIANYRDSKGGFRSIGELMIDANSSPDSIGYYEGKSIPDVLRTPEDCAGDIFEERDVIFDRISNLVTVRSDVFTAYILVRIGADGPQKRVVAILDRSGVTKTGGKVKVI